MDWYLLQTKPRLHIRAREHGGNKALKFLPLIWKTVKKNGKFLDTTVPLFPGYIFMGTATNPALEECKRNKRHLQGRNTRQVYRPIDIRIIEGLQRRCDKNDVIQKMDHIVKGDRAKIEKGTFPSLFVQSRIEDGQRAWVLIDLLKQKTRAKVSVSHLSKIS